jgi:hypothetical protein
LKIAVEWVVPELDEVEVGRVGTVGAGVVVPAPVVGLVDEAEAAWYAAQPTPLTDSSLCRSGFVKPASSAIRMMPDQAKVVEWYVRLLVYRTEMIVGADLVLSIAAAEQTNLEPEQRLAWGPASRQGR